MRLLVTGAGGMLGCDLLRAAKRAGHEATALDRTALDVTDERAVALAFSREPADAAINCAAWTDVDGAETHREQAYAVNAGGAAKLARAAAQAGVPLVHVSTDYVFDGDPPHDAAGSPRAYVESDPTGPRSVYGESKLAGEAEVLAASPRHAVVRSSWLFGVDGHNFVATMLRLASEQETTGPSGATRPSLRNPVAPSVRVVDDQTGSPTWTGHLAPALIGLLERGVVGLAHLAGAGHVSWNGLAKETFRQAEVICRVDPATSAEMARPAPRPAWSALESERDDVLRLPPWQDGLAGYLAARAGMIRR